MQNSLYIVEEYIHICVFQYIYGKIWHTSYLNCQSIAFCPVACRNRLARLKY